MRQFILKKISVAASVIPLLITTPSLAACWQVNDLFEDAVKNHSSAFLAFPTSPLTSDWNSSNNQQHVNYFTLINNGWHVAEFYWDGKSGFWQGFDLTSGSHALSTAAPGSPLHRYWNGDGSQHINYAVAALDLQTNKTQWRVHELYLLPGGNEATGWGDRDLMLGDNFVAAPGSALTGYASAGNDQHINYLDDAGHVHELFNHSLGQQWTDTDLTNRSSGTPAAPGSALVADYNWQTDQQHINFIDKNNNVHELVFPISNQWQDNNLTGSIKARPAAPNSPLTRYWDSSGGQHINFLDEGGHIIDLNYQAGRPPPQWLWGDMTAQATNGTSAVQTRNGLLSALTGDWEIGGALQQHVNFFVAQSDGWHVHELVHPASGQDQKFWVDNDLTALATAMGCGVYKPAKPGSGLHRYWGPGNDQSVYFIDPSGVVRQLYYPSTSQ